MSLRSKAPWAAMIVCGALCGLTQCGEPEAPPKDNAAAKPPVKKDPAPAADPPKRGDPPPASSEPAAQQKPAPAPAEPPKKDDAPAADAPKLDAATLYRKMEFLFPKAADRPQPDYAALAADPKLLAAEIKREKDWDDAIKNLAQTTDDYVTALGGAAPEARALYYRGFAHFLWSTRAAPDKRKSLRVAADSLQRYVDAVDQNDAYRPDAELLLGKSLMFQTSWDPTKIDSAVAHLRSAVELLQKERRRDDAGDAADTGLRQLQSLGRDADAAAFAGAVHAADADFGRWTEGVRVLVAGTKFAVGSKLPALPDVKDVDGNPISFDPAGKPLLVHFFMTNRADGSAAPYREVETEIVPLADRYREKGLRLVGVCMDFAFPKERAEKMRADWKEWGRKGEFRDGSLESDREWANEHAIKWQWYWDGMWTRNPISMALGGAGAERPFAVLVDKDGYVRWKGSAPFEGLSAAVAKAMQ